MTDPNTTSAFMPLFLFSAWSGLMLALGGLLIRRYDAWQMTRRCQRAWKQELATMPPDDNDLYLSLEYALLQEAERQAAKLLQD